jgi:tRNA A-37 threonylcarbamoyl transferase component Bud32
MRIRHAILLLSGGPVLLAQAWPTFYSAYEDGLAAQKRGDHALALKAFARAAALSPRPGRRVQTYGLNFLPAYHPYLRMAESALALGNLDLAEAALGDSARFGLEPQPEREALLGRLREARRALLPAPVSGAVAPATPAMSAAPVGGPAAASVPVQIPMPVPVQPGRSAPAATSSAGRPSSPVPARPGHAPAGTVPVPGPGTRPSADQPPSGTDPPARTGRPASGTGRPWAWLALIPLLGGGGAAILAARRRRRPGRSEAITQAQSTPWAEGLPDGDPDGDANVGRAFGPWIALRRVGQGGNATTYYGVNPETGQEVAIKVPHPHLMRNPEVVERFRREAMLGTRLDHPNLVRILDPGPSGGSPWLVMPFIRGRTLEEHLRETTLLPVDQCIRIACDVADAMAYAHAQGVVHRDLKPGNIMLGPAGAVVLDLGIARLTDSHAVTSMYIGTPTYSAPESMSNPSVGPSADRYALGVILFEMLAGQPPFVGVDAFQVLEAHRFEPLPDLRARRPLVPPSLARLVERLCAKDPGQRPEDGESLSILRAPRD